MIMNISRKILYISTHCSAGFSLIPAIEKFWYNTLKWKSPGYHIIIYEDGTKWYVTSNGSYSQDVTKLDLNKITNGVQGFNSESVHICYIGGVLRTNTSVAADTRTPAQKKSIREAISLVQTQLKASGQDISKVKIQGHRDFSPDKNGNGVIEPWERIKECPSFDAIPEYKDMIPTSAPKPTMYTLSNLNLRSGAGTDFCKNGDPIPKGEAVQLIEKKADWSKVLLKDGRTGFVSTKYLR